MKKTLIGIVTFGNLPFTQLTINTIRATTTKPVDFFIIVGKPGDRETLHWLMVQMKEHGDLNFMVHNDNKGFPASLNDIYDYTWGLFGAPRKVTDYDHLIIVGNDVVPYPGAVDALIECAETTDYEWIASSQLDVQSLCGFHPEARQYFEGDNFKFEHWSVSEENGAKHYTPLFRPWEMHKDFRAPSIEANAMRDCHNLCLFKRSVAEKIGYIDVNFFPAYFSDNDYNRRATLAGVKGCTLPHSAYFHFWSRTIHQGSGGSNSTFFGLNSHYYQEKWGGGPGAETRSEPVISESVSQWVSETGLKISSRAHEAACVQYWKERAAV